MGASDEPADKMRGRVPGNSRKLWFLLGANRWLIAAIILAFVGVGLVVVVRLDPAPVTGAISASDPVETLFQALVTAIITGVTLVVSINSLVLSQELGALGDQQERMSGSISFRNDVSDALDAPVSPAEPSAFLRAIVELTGDRAERLRDAVGDGHDDDVREHVTDYVDDVVTHSSDVASDLDGTEFGTFDLVFAALNFNYSWKAYQARRMRADIGDQLSDEAGEAFDDLIDALLLFGPAREHVKTLYFQWELVDLSREMMYAAVPALIVGIGGILTLDNTGSVPGITFGIANQVWVTLAATLVALIPFALLLSYMVRIGTVAKRTLAIGPFILRETDKTGGVGGPD